MVERQIICGDAYSFQGDERDVMFLSLVIAPNMRYNALNKKMYTQRLMLQLVVRSVRCVYIIRFLLASYQRKIYVMNY